MMDELLNLLGSAKRMCESYSKTSCEGCELHEKYGMCPLVAKDSYVVPAEWQMTNIQRAMNVVKRWEEANPAPKYPTWKEYLEQIGVIEQAEIQCDADSTRRNIRRILHGVDQQIFGEIAKKLGIEEVGGSAGMADGAGPDRRRP